MSPEKLANNFINEFDKLSSDNKSKCLTEIASIFSTKYDVNLCVQIEVNDANLDVTENYYEEHTLPLSGTTVEFVWGV